jgi:hypothetical protein
MLRYSCAGASVTIGQVPHSLPASCGGCRQEREDDRS